MRTKIAIACENVRFGYARAGEMSFDFAIPAGELTAVMGPSGSGKSTLFSLIAGFEAPDRGRIVIGGEDVTRLPPGRRPISHVFQDNNLFAHLDVITNVGLGIAPNRRLSADQRETAMEALARVGLGGLENRAPSTLSGGERQRVALARALVRRRPVLLLDEAFAALGPRLREEMLELVGGLHEEASLTTLMITHQPADARAIADAVLFLAGGKAVAHRPVPAVFEMDDLPGWRDYLGNAVEAGGQSG